MQATTIRSRFITFANAVAWLALALAAASCSVGTVQESPVALSQQTRLTDRLYFGRVHASGVVSEHEWAAFLAEVVTPRFPEGLTVWGADGQWQDGARRIVVREPTFVLELVHTKNGNRDADLKAVVAAYKKRFSQHSVLWVRDRVVVID